METTKEKEYMYETNKKVDGWQAVRQPSNNPSNVRHSAFQMEKI